MIFRSTRAAIVAAIISVSCSAATSASADDLTVDKIRAALSPAPTRSLSAHSPDTGQDSGAFVDTLRNKPVASLTGDERAKLAVFKADKPSIDLELRFDFNSDVLRGEALKTADLLGKAIASPEFKDRTFLIAGYTDAKGNDQLNQTLSERRAEAVKLFLLKRYHIPAENLIAVGYGRTSLKNTADPTAAENRRVQAVNLLSSRSASR